MISFALYDVALFNFNCITMVTIERVLEIKTRNPCFLLESALTLTTARVADATEPAATIEPPNDLLSKVSTLSLSKHGHKTIIATPSYTTHYKRICRNTPTFFGGCWGLLSGTTVSHAHTSFPVSCGSMCSPSKDNDSWVCEAVNINNDNITQDATLNKNQLELISRTTFTDMEIAFVYNQDCLKRLLQIIK